MISERHRWSIIPEDGGVNDDVFSFEESDSKLLNAGSVNCVPVAITEVQHPLLLGLFFTFLGRFILCLVVINKSCKIASIVDVMKSEMRKSVFVVDGYEFRFHIQPVDEILRQVCTTKICKRHLKTDLENKITKNVSHNTLVHVSKQT